MDINKQNIFNELSKVIDPISKKDIISNKLFKAINVNGLQVEIQLEFPPMYSKVNQLEIKQIIIDHLHSTVSEDIIFDFKFTTTAIKQAQKPNVLPNVKNIIAVASGKGGVGKSTVTANLAIALSKSGAKVGIVDADIFGPSMPTMFGVEDKKPTVVPHEGKNMLVPVDSHDIGIMSIGFLAPPEQAIVWRGSMATSALKQFFTDTDWGELDYLLIDLPPGTSDIHLTVVQTLPITGAVIVTTPQKVAIIDAQKAISMFKQEQINVPVLGVIENMAYFTPEELPNNKYYIFGKDGGDNLAKKFDIPLLGQIPIAQSIRENGDEGTPEIISEKSSTFKAFMELGEKVIKATNERNLNLDPTKVVQVSR